MRLFRFLRRKSDLTEELESHLKMAIAERVARGQSPEEARRSALHEFGNVPMIADVTRNQWGWLRLEQWLQDVRYALRQLRKEPGFTLTVVITLALGIGANTAIFTLVQGILLRSLPVNEPSRLYRIGDKNDCCYYNNYQNDNGDFDIFSYDLYLHLKQAAPEFEQLAAVEAGGNGFSVRKGAEPARPMRSEYVSGNYFATLGVGAYVGRVLSENDDTPGAAPTLVLSYKTWQADFAGDPGIVGSTLYVQTHPFVVAGIAPPGFFGDRIISNPPDFWMPLASEPVLEGANSALKGTDELWLYPLGRVHPAANIQALQAKLSVALQQWLATRPTYADHGGAALIPRQHVVLAPAGGGIQRLQQQTGTGLRLMMILSTVVLLIACANIANLLLARCTARRADVAVRIALGASRFRVIREILTESVLLSLMGGAAGLAVAYAGSYAMLMLAFPAAKNMPVQALPSTAVLAFTFVVSVLTGIVFGTVPAWLASYAQPVDALRGVNRSTADRSSLPQRILIVFQVALSMVLLAGALLMTKSLHNLEHQNFGITTANRYVVSTDPKGVGYTVDRLPALYQQIEDRFAALPGMANVSLVRYIPLGGNMWGSCVIPQGHAAPGPKDPCFAAWDRASTRFLDSIGVPIVRGRNFSTQDTATSQQVVLVNQAFARHFFPNQDPIGKHFGVGSIQYSGAFEIAGVFADFKMTDPRGEVRPLFFRPLSQQFHGYKESDVDAAEKSSMYLNFIILDFAQAPADVETLTRRTLADIDPSLPVMHFSPYDAEVAGNFNQDRLLARLTSGFGALALILASVGLYGVMSYFVVRRTSEIGIRMALGAARSGVVAMMLRGALWQILVGLAIGIPAALIAGHFMASLLYGVKPYDPLAFFGAIVLLTICAVVAGFIPSRRAASIDPMKALRAD
ncbi:ABC transporter permease [Terriglobus albidus]|uniref:ABC transporter permease n=1 Tax=Terriglobus albidus TaxID=1592106 RepID=A0A5B9E520_9BACT|nr:ABC transporter permease [Terriglobus albidus]QEE27088.1 ABC transporter permease [Terriglobus albidus]